MMKLNRHMVLGLAVVALALPTGVAVANPAQDAPDMSYALNLHSNWQTQNQSRVAALYAQRQPQSKISASQAKSAAMSRHRGAKFVDVRLVNSSTYKVRLQKNGKIIDVKVDAYSGQVKG